MKPLLSSSSVAVCLSLLLLTACVPVPTVTPVAVLPTATPLRAVSATPILTPTPKPTATPTSVATPTATSVATSRPTSTPTAIPPTPTATPTPTPSNSVTVLVSSLNVREGPSTRYRVVDVLDRGTSVSAIADNGKSGDEVWYQVELSDGLTGWISGHSQYASVSGDLWNRLGTGKWKALPTPAPTPLPNLVLPGARQRYSFEEVVPLLSSPELVSLFMQNNISFIEDPENVNQDAKTTFERGGGDCEDYAMFALHCLLSNGYVYDDFDLHQSNAACGLDVQWGQPDAEGRYPRGHAVCLYKDKGLFYFLDNFGVKRGPFYTVQETVERIAKDNNIQWGRYTFFNIGFVLTREVRR